MKKVYWDLNGNPTTQTLQEVMNAIRNDDMAKGLFYEPITLDDVLDETAPLQDSLMLDAIVVQNARLKSKMLAMKRMLNQAGKTLSVDDTAPIISDPFTQNGTANIVAMFPLSDGQTISVYFHNPDVTPKKITSQDQLISWKWYLNKKDITIVVAPERGQEVQILQVAKRVMAIAEKNSEAFSRVNRRTAERRENVARLEKEVAEKEAIYRQKLEEIDRLEREKSDQEVEQAIREQEEKAKVAQGELPMSEAHLAKFYNAVKARLASFGWNGEQLSNEDNSKQIIMELNSYESEIELRQSNNGIVFTRLADIKLLNKHTVDQIAEEIQRVASEALGISTAPAQTQLQDTPQTEPISITGKEFGEFDVSTTEGISKLRTAVSEHLSKFTGVFCKALNANVEISNKGIDKYISFSANPIKLYIASKIDVVIANASIFKPSEERYDQTPQRNKLIYHYLKTPFKFNGEEYGARIVVREDHQGHFHWDLRIKDDVNAILDGINENGANLLLATNPGLINTASGQFDLGNDNTPTLDDVSSGYVLNLFVFDKDGNEIKDEEEVGNEPDNQSDNTDEQFLQDVIDGKIDVMADDFHSKFETIATALYETNPELVEQATNAYIAKTDEYAQQGA